MGYSAEDERQKAIDLGSSIQARIDTIVGPSVGPGPHLLPLLLSCDADLKVELSTPSVDDKAACQNGGHTEDGAIPAPARV